MLHLHHMKTKDLKGLLERVPEWPKEAQQELLRSMTEIETRYNNVYHVNDEERAALNRSAEDARRGRFATERDVEAAFSRFHRP
jgi:hypothetical protein